MSRKGPYATRSCCRALQSGALRLGAVLIIGLLLVPAAAGAQQWDEAYRAGLTALARGDHARAADAFKRAIALRPEPGRNILTYGTNVEARYFPYLHLADAYLGLGQLEAAREALDKSASFGEREPASERHKVAVRLDAAFAQRRPPAPTPPPTLTPTPVATPPSETPAPPAPAPSAAVATPTAQPAPREPAHPGHVVDREPRPEAPPQTRADPSRPASPAPAVGAATGMIEVLSRPAGASVYIDDEPVGATDPQSGRLVKTGLPPGGHRVRVSRAGHEDAVRDVAVAAGSTATFSATLTPVAGVSAGARAGLIAFALVAIGLVVVIAWIALRRPEQRALSDEATPRSRSAPGLAATPPAQINPGARSDEQGQEWFGDFRLLEMLGKGGMASVFKVQRRGETSALKRPLGMLLDDPQFLERFLREAEIGRALNHPNIIRILERGKVGSVPYFTMELLPGQTLHDFIAERGAAAPRTAAAIVVQVAEALDFAHSKGVVHRDLKPSNVMLLPDGTAKVMDFGIARARRFEGMTATAAFLGTPDYVAPETIDGRGTEPRSDLYALGLILFELLTGQRPFIGDTPFAVLKKHCTEEAPPPARVRPGVPAELDAIVMQLLRKNPEERPASAEDLVVALRDWLNRAA
jgi:protein kinase-like protein/PEGA domain-containing protein/tetratricopeptide repeat protein